jgi:hypothetical protein
MHEARPGMEGAILFLPQTIERNSHDGPEHDNEEKGNLIKAHLFPLSRITTRADWIAKAIESSCASNASERVAMTA